MGALSLVHWRLEKRMWGSANRVNEADEIAASRQRTMLL